MRFVAFAVAGLCAFAPAVARGESADELRAKGERLAKEGRFTEAIDSFKASNKLADRASNYCLIGLAYTRRELWPQAEIFLDQCHRRATAADPMPDWVPVVDKQLADRLAQVNVAAVEIVVEPAGTNAVLAVSSFAPDELFGPRTIHLPPGHHVIVARATGFMPTEQSIDVVDRTPQRIVVQLAPVSAGPPAPPTDKPVTPVITAHHASKVPTILIATGGGVLVAGAIVHLVAFRPARNDLQAASDRMNDIDWRKAEPRFDRWRLRTIGLYATGAVLLGTGIVLRQTVFKLHEASVQVGAIPTAGGGLVSVEWTQ